MREAHDARFHSDFWCGYLHQSIKYYKDSLSFYSTFLNANFDFDVSVAIEVAIDVAKCTLPGKVMK